MCTEECARDNMCYEEFWKFWSVSENNTNKVAAVI